MKVIISILHYNSSKDTITCLDSLLGINLGNIEIETYVLDNGSKEPIRIDSKTYKKINLTVLRNKENTGFTGGHNRIYEKVQDKVFDYFVLLNNDCILEENSIFKLLKYSNDDSIGAIVPKIYFTKGQEFHKDRYRESELGNVLWYAGGFVDWNNVQSKHIGIDEVDKGQYNNAKKIDFATGACLAIRKKVITKIGLFDEKFFLYFEDADLSQRIVRNGFGIMYCPDSIVWHNNAGSSGSGSELHDYYLTRNRMLFGMKYAAFKIKIHLIRESLRLIIQGREWQKKGIRDYYLRKFGMGSFVKKEMG